MPWEVTTRWCARTVARSTKRRLRARLQPPSSFRRPWPAGQGSSRGVPPPQIPRHQLGSGLTRLSIGTGAGGCVPDPAGAGDTHNPTCQTGGPVCHNLPVTKGIRHGLATPAREGTQESDGARRGHGRGRRADGNSRRAAASPRHLPALWPSRRGRTGATPAGVAPAAGRRPL